MHLPSLFVLVVYVSAYVVLLFGAISLACGLYYLVELAEEYTQFTKRLIYTGIMFELALHFLLWAYEGMWLVPNLFGFLSHLSYLLLLRSFPYIIPSSVQFIFSCAMFVSSNVIWYRYFLSDPEFFYQYRVGPMTSIAFFFFLTVWLVPLGFFVSLTVNDAVLPSAASIQYGAHSAAVPNHFKQLNNAAAGDGRKKPSQNILVVSARNAWGSMKAATGIAGTSSSSDILSSATHYSKSEPRWK